MLLTQWGRKKNAFRQNFWLFDGEGDAGSATGASGSTSSSVVNGGSAATEYVPTQSGSVEGEVPTTPPTASQTSSVDWNTIIPADLRDRPYFQNILKAADPGAELVKQFDGAQKLIGQRSTGVPDANATDEEWAKFYETLRPKSVDDYDFKPLELAEENKDIADYINKTRDPEFLKEVKALMYEEGLTKRQAEKLVSRYEVLNATKFGDKYRQAIDGEKAVAEARTKMETEFGDLAKKSFGGDHQKALDYGREFIATHLPANLKHYMDGFSNEALIAFAAAGMSVYNKYGKEDSIINPGHSTGLTETELRAEMRQLMSTDAGRNKFNPDYERTQKQIKQLTGQIVDLQNNGKR